LPAKRKKLPAERGKIASGKGKNFQHKTEIIASGKKDRSYETGKTHSLYIQN
jgi:hypothetical protein